MSSSANRLATAFVLAILVQGFPLAHAQQCAQPLGGAEPRKIAGTAAYTIEFDSRYVILLETGHTGRAVLARVVGGPEGSPHEVVIAFPERKHRLSSKGRFIARYEGIYLVPAPELRYLGQGTIRVPVYRIVGRVPSRKNVASY